MHSDQATEIQAFSAFRCRCHLATAAPDCIPSPLSAHFSIQRPEALPQVGMSLHLLFPGPLLGNL